LPLHRLLQDHRRLRPRPGSIDVIPFTYLEPSSLEEALELLARHGSEAKLIAGGTGLVNLMKQRLVRPAYVIGLRALNPLSGTTENDGLRIGALATLGTL